MTIDTACSSALVALHSAKLALARGECSMAVVSGVNELSGVASMMAAKAGMLSKDGKCHTFDAGANGYARGEGCGSFIVKRSADAVDNGNGNSIYAVI